MSVKSPLTEGEKVTAKAIELHRRMVSRESRGPGDTDNAMRRLETTYGLDYWAQWVCRYRREVTLEFAQRLHWTWRSMLGRSVANDLGTLVSIQQDNNDADDDAELEGLMAQAAGLLAEIQAKKARQ